MSALAWAFAAGGLAVALPILFHIIRRTPKDRQEFSSLMFLEESPPQLTRRSRLDDLLLLLLRALALLLLAAAFTRPFLQDSSTLNGNANEGRAFVLALDTSGSMRRDGLWDAAIDEAKTLLDSLEPDDQVALLTFGGDAELAVDFSDADPASQREQVRQSLDAIEPSWWATDIGAALVRAAERLRDRSTEEDAPIVAGQQIVLITDLQDGADRNALQGFDWPAEIAVDVRPVRAASASNASMRLLAEQLGESPADAETPPLRIRVRNTSDAEQDEFRIGWQRDANETSDEQSFVVPAGESRVRELPVEATASVLQLSGDAADFDNQYFIAPPQPRAVRVRYFGDDDRDDPEGPLFYLSRAITETPLRTVEVVTDSEDANERRPQLTVVTKPLSDEEVETVTSNVEAGGSLIAVLRDPDMAASLEPLIGDTQAAPTDTGAGQSDRLLAEIDFASPLFAPFDSPRFNDFTDIRFWRATAVELAEDPSLNVVARFDDEMPAVWTRRLGEGTVFVFTSGWQPEDSQLALSNKFVPLVERMLAAGTPRELPRLGYLVGDAVPIDRSPDESVTVVSPDGETTSLDETDRFEATDAPGIYEVRRGDDVQRFAVNIAPSESRTTPFDADTLEQFGVTLGIAETAAERLDRQRALRDRELEQRQKLWKWLVAAAIAMVALETLLSGRRARQSDTVRQSTAAEVPA